MRFGVEPYDSRRSACCRSTTDIAKMIGDKLGCQVKVFIATNYNAEIEAMRNGKLEIGEFGPLGYVLAHQVAKAEAVAAFGDKDGKPRHLLRASIVTWPGSRHRQARGHPGQFVRLLRSASTSGHLFPAYGLRKNGIDPDKDIKAIYAGSHTASFEALRNHKVDGRRAQQRGDRQRQAAQRV